MISCADNDSARTTAHVPKCHPELVEGSVKTLRRSRTCHYEVRKLDLDAFWVVFPKAASLRSFLSVGFFRPLRISRFALIRAFLSRPFLRASPWQVRKVRLELGDAGQGALEFLGQGTGELVFGHADGFLDSAQGILGNDAVFVLAENEADAGLIPIVTHPVIHGVEVEIHFPGILRLEWTDLQVNHDEAAELEVIEKEIEIEVVVAHFHVNLPAGEGEPGPEIRTRHEQFDERRTTLGSSGLLCDLCASAPSAF